MASAVLRKRTRSAFEVDVTVIEEPAKKRATTRKIAITKGRENSIPIYDSITVKSLPKREQNQDVMDIDTTSSPLKAQSPSKRNVLSPPTKVNSVYKITKAVAFDNVKRSTVVPATPSKKDRVQVIPITPRHRVMLPGSLPRTPKTPADRLVGVSTPGTPLTPSSKTIFSSGKNLFVRSTAPGKLVGREKERAQLMDFFTSSMEKKTGGCLYVSGPPGTGKSALLSEVMGEIVTDGVKRAYINCMTTKDPKGIYSKLAEEFLGEESILGNDVDALERLFVPKKKTLSEVFVVVLDEMDSLLTKDQEILYKIFEWSFAKTSKLVLVGIANALDLTDRFLPRLKARNFEPILLPVLPYTAEQIAEVVKSRLQSLNDDTCEKSWVPLIHPAAITLCAKKVAQSTGDLRKCFDICRKAIHMVEHETRTKLQAQSSDGSENSTPTKSQDVIMKTPAVTPRKPLGETINQASPPQSLPISHIPMSIDATITLTPKKSNPLQTYTPLTAPRATLSHIARISTTSFGITSTHRLQLLNLQQKAVICSLCVLSRKTNGGGVALKDLWESYKQLCTRDKTLTAVSKPEFVDVVGSLETCGVVDMQNGNGGGSGLFGAGGSTPRGRKSKNASAGGDERRIRTTVKEDEVKKVLVGDGGEILLKFFSEGL